MVQGGFAAQELIESDVQAQPKPDLRQASYAGIISECQAMQRVFSIIEKVAKSDSTVLVLGESGTGKELVARALHKQSKRRGKLVPVNCGAIPEEILESELFGHEKGSFTGATSSRVGRFQLADGGTIFLDEIGEMSPKLQVKLLRVLQEKCVEPVGSTRSIPVDVRIVAATNKDLWEEVQKGNFREDLFFRLQVVPIELPPLRQRAGDIRLLANYFLHRTCSQNEAEEKQFSDEVLSSFDRYQWVGNVRELENLVERLVLLSDEEEITANELPSYIRNASSKTCAIIETNEQFPDDGICFNDMVNQFESSLILKALEKTEWNKKAAARLLNLNRTTLVEKIKKKGLEKSEETEAETEPLRPVFN